MAQFANSHDRYDLATTGENVREELSDIIYNISPMDTPFVSYAGKGKAENTYSEWLVDALQDTDTGNAQIDGDEFAGAALNAADRVGNYAQISWKEIVVTRRANLVNKAGRKSELAYQEMKAGRALKRDIEAIAMANQVGLAGNSTTAPTTAAVAGWMGTFTVAGPNKVEDNTSRGATGTDPTLSNTTYGFPDTAGADGTVRALTEDGMLSMIKAAYVNGGNPGTILMGPTVKQLWSKYMFTANARVATQYQDQGKKPGGGVSVVGAVDYYVSDFGTLEIHPNRFQRERDVWILDMEYWSIDYLDGFKTETFAKTGDAEKRKVLVDWMVCSKQEAASSVYADVDSTAAVTAS